MRTKKLMAEEVLVARAVEVLMKALGPVETARFFNMPRQRRKESVKRHRLWQATLKNDAFFDQVFSQKS